MIWRLPWSQNKLLRFVRTVEPQTPGLSATLHRCSGVAISTHASWRPEAKKKEKKKPEIKKIVQSWVIDGSEKKEASISSSSKDKLDDGIRYRKGKHR